MSVGLDTSIVVRLVTGEPPDLAAVALRFLRRRLAAGDRVLINDLVIAEAYYALQHHYGASKKEALQVLRDLAGETGIESTGEARKILEIARLESAKPGFVDRVIHADYLRSGAQQMASFERAAKHLPKTIVLTP